MTYQPQDAFYRRAKKEGYRSRAAYKLLELNRRFHLIRPGDRLVDLGAAPGGWLQIASRLAGERGKVVGVDIQAMEPFKEPNVLLVQGDIAAEETRQRVKELLGLQAHCILSDLSPRLTGIHHADVSRSVELVRAAFEFAEKLLKPGGSFLAKTFLGDGTDALFVELKPRFASLQRTRPEATRKGSSEIYFIGKGFKGSS